MTLPPLRYRAVLFDLDGTLVDSYAALSEAVNYARRESGLHELSAARIRDFIGDGLDTLLRRAFDTENVPRRVKDAFESRYDEICCQESTILADVEATLETLHGFGVAMAVCTNKPTSFSKKILTFLELSRYFRAIVGPDLAGARKPDARHVLVPRTRNLVSRTRNLVPSNEKPRSWNAKPRSGTPKIFSMDKKPGSSNQKLMLAVHTSGS